jgi:beta-aspartyl-dipeptidase (metallo-type)
VFTLLRRAEVFAPSPLGVVDVLLAFGKVAAIGRGLEPPKGVPVEEMDLGGRRLVPGLIDAHVHVTGGGGESGPSSRVPPITLTDLTTAGVTTCVGLLGTDTTTRSIESLVARTLGLREEGLSAHCWTGGYAVPPRTLTGSVRSDIVFVDPILGAGEIAVSDARSSQPTLDEILRLAADCHVAGMMSGKAGVLHLHVGDGARGLDLVRKALDTSELPARTFHPTHVNRNKRLFEEAAALAERGVTMDVTAYPADDSDPGLSAEEAIVRWIGDKLPRERLTVSSDGAGCLPVFDDHGRVRAMDVGRPRALSDALTALLKRGLGLQDVIGFFTSHVADVLRLAHKGRIFVGGDADLVALSDEGVVQDVLARGRWVVRDALPVTLGPFERKKEET